MTDIPTIAEAAAAIAAKSLSPVELTQDCLARTKAVNPTLHAFVTVTEERAIADAKAAEAKIMSDGPSSPMHGIPIAHKDIIDTKGILTTCQSKQLETSVPDADATCVGNLDKAGAVLIGKLTTHEFADGGPSFDLPWPPARNPWDPARFTAGSSSGTGAAVAAGLVLGGTGTDTGGSIRGPSSLCGIAGIKPTYGLVSRAGVAPAAYSLDHIGPMCWTAEDCAVMLQGLAGYDPKDPASANRPVPDFSAELSLGGKDLCVGLIRNFHETDREVIPAVQQSIDDAVKTFQDMGATVTDIVLPPLQDYAACGMAISAVERFAAYETWSQERMELFGSRYRDRMFLGSFITGADYIQAVRMRRELTLKTVAAMADVDVLLTAANPGEAPLIDKVARWDNLVMPNFTMPFNVTGLPAMSLCGGFGPNNLPLGLQIIGKPFQEATVIRAGHAYEMATSWRSARPTMNSAKAA